MVLARPWESRPSSGSFTQAPVASCTATPEPPSHVTPRMSSTGILLRPLSERISRASRDRTIREITVSATAREAVRASATTAKNHALRPCRRKNTTAPAVKIASAIAAAATSQGAVPMTWLSAAVLIARSPGGSRARACSRARPRGGIRTLRPYAEPDRSAAWIFSTVAQFRVVTPSPSTRPTASSRRLARMPAGHHR